MMSLCIRSLNISLSVHVHIDGYIIEDASGGCSLIQEELLLLIVDVNLVLDTSGESQLGRRHLRTSVQALPFLVKSSSAT